MRRARSNTNDVSEPENPLFQATFKFHKLQNEFERLQRLQRAINKDNDYNTEYHLAKAQEVLQKGKLRHRFQGDESSTDANEHLLLSEESFANMKKAMEPDIDLANNMLQYNERMHNEVLDIEQRHRLEQDEREEIIQREARLDNLLERDMQEHNLRWRNGVQHGRFIDDNSYEDNIRPHQEKGYLVLRRDARRHNGEEF